MLGEQVLCTFSAARPATASGSARLHEWSELRLRTGAQRRLDDAVAGPDQGGEFGPRMHVQLLVNVHQMRRDRPLADEKAAGDLAIRKPVDHVADYFALAIT